MKWEKKSWKTRKTYLDYPRVFVLVHTMIFSSLEKKKEIAIVYIKSIFTFIRIRDIVIKQLFLKRSLLLLNY